ncbi:partial Protoporphyrinogen oxidase, partial [Myxococcaceae bacterium]
MTQALVVGGGAAGLAAALELQRRGVEVRLIEATPRVGGVVQTEHREGYLFERGPNTMQGKPTLRPFLEANALEPLLVPASPASRRRWLWHDGRLEAVPMDPLSFLRTRLLTGRGKLRLLREPFVARGDASRESVDEFVRRRLGDEALENLVAPFLTGVYAGDE